MGTPIRAPLKETSKEKAEKGFLVPGSQPAPQAHQQTGPPGAAAAGEAEEGRQAWAFFALLSCVH